MNTKSCFKDFFSIMHPFFWLFFLSVTTFGQKLYDFTFDEVETKAENKKVTKLFSMCLCKCVTQVN